jgi:DNA replication and repair protein RecF
MRLLHLSLQNFRNINEASLDFTPGAQLLVGKNAQGKTSLLEAVYFLATATSPRTRSNRELIRRGADSAWIQAEFERHGRVHTLSAGFDEEQRRFRIDGGLLPKTSDLYGNLRAVFFSPEDLELLSAGPAVRRRMLDLGMCQRAPGMVRVLVDYKKALKQRNALLKSRGTNPALRAWSHELARLGAQITQRRSQHALDILGCAAGHYTDLTQSREELAGLFRSSGAHQAWRSTEEIPPVEELEKALEENLTQTLDRDLALGMTTTGPHRDDLIFEIAGVSAERFASQGQRRSMVLALRLAERDILLDQGDAPLLLVDDVTHEMDAARCQRFLEKVSTQDQAFLTFTEEESHRGLIHEATLWQVESGKFLRTLKP